VTARFTVTNTGARAGADVPQLYLVAPRRLLAFERVELDPGESRRVTLTAEPRLLARFDDRWVIAGGEHEVAVAASAEAPVVTATVALTGRAFAR
jgi:beta-glucosidase